MRISRITLKPWAGAAERSLELRAGVNVVLGENDVGKSSLFHAIDRALFVPAKLHKRTYEELIRRFVPVQGDTASVELELREGDAAWKLLKVWGAAPRAQLTLPDGSLLTDDIRIQGELAKILPAPEPTLKSVFLTRQAGLEQTLDELRAHPEALHSLGDLLRQAVLATDGVSVEKLRQRLEELHLEYFNRWDPVANAPTNGRQRFQRDVGVVLAAHYEREDATEKLRQAQQSEGELDRLNQQLRTRDAEVERAREFVRQHQKVVDDLQTRRGLSTALESARARLQALTGDYQIWTQFEAQLPRLREEVKDLRANVDRLMAESRASAAERDRQALRERWNAVRARKQAQFETEARLIALPKFTRESLQRLSMLQTRLETLKASLGHGKLEVSVALKSGAAPIRVQRDLEEEASFDVRSGKPLQISAGGQVRLEVGDWEIMLRSGESPIDQVAKADGEWRALMREHGVEGMAHAQKLCEDYEAAFQDARVATRSLQEALGARTFEEWQAKSEALDAEVSCRGIEAVMAELNPQQTRLGAKGRELEQSEAQWELLKRRHQTEDSSELLIAMAERKSEEKTLDTQLSVLAPLPAEASDETAFLSAFRRAQDDVTRLAVEIRELLSKISDVKAAMPDESVEELRKRLQDAEEEFERVRRRGAAIRRVKEAAEAVLARSGQDVYGGLRPDFERTLVGIVGEKYRRAELTAGLPEKLQRGDGAEIPYALLSGGLKDAVALSLRLSMAEHFLGARGGFLLLDDPLVNLDPARQAKAAAAIREFSARGASDRQVVLFTCHPSHAAMLTAEPAVLV